MLFYCACALVIIIYRTKYILQSIAILCIICCSARVRPVPRPLAKVTWWQLLPDQTPPKEEPVPSFPQSSDHHCCHVFPSRMEMKQGSTDNSPARMPNQKKRPACGFKREVGREDTGRYLTDSALQDLSLSSSMAGSLSVASYSTLPSPYSGPCLTCWTARQPRHSPPSARPPVLPIRDSQGGDRHHDFALALYCHGAHVPVWWAAEAIDGQLQEHISRVGVQISQTFQVSTYLQLMPWCSPATTYLQLKSTLSLWIW